ncbi:Centrosomal protein of 68 kDa [Channa argus]|uniref:Centrosomal protein of 68 kDa n=1 Tax=Channa argus TaxID=215402 RepID=A0A6G1R1Z5_CHAAH|nr:Centrosomal protein of 68 kDa [Channa argus]
MEAKGCNHQQKSFPDFKHSRSFSSTITKDGEKANAERDKGGPHKSVTLAPTSRYLTDRQYVMRKPLFSSEQQTSILKKKHPPKHTEKEKQVDVSRGEHTDRTFLSRAREELTVESFSRSYRDNSPLSVSSDDLYSPLGVSELSGRFCHEGPTFGSHFSSSRSPQLSLSRSILEIQTLNSPLRPHLASTVLYPTYIRHTGHSRPGRTQMRFGGTERRVGAETKLSTIGRHSKGENMTPHQWKYWACAIPKGLPPSPNRCSPDWEPDREYQGLLDYTYPLRPGEVVSAWDSSELLEDTLLSTDLQDSGIELEHLCSSTNLSGLDLTRGGRGNTAERSPLSANHCSSDPPGHTGSSDDLTSSTPLSQTNPVGLSLEGLDCSDERGVGLNNYKSVCHPHWHHAQSSSTSTPFIRSTSVLPQSRCVGGEMDEEFWRLPDQLDELQQLSKQVREVTVQLSRPVRSSWESLEPGITSILSSITLPEKQDAEEEEAAEVKDPESFCQDTAKGKDEMGRGEKSDTQMAAHHRDCVEVKRTSGDWVEPFGDGGQGQSSLREAEALVRLLSGLTLPGNQGSRQEVQDQRESLMKHIQVFCSHLERLIQQLYTLSEKMELLAAPTVDMDSVKSSLADYQSFQREVSSHRPLTSCVLHAGQLLLSCINTTSPLLRNALLLIERQSVDLQTHTEHFLSSIVSAMDSLTQPSQPSPVQNSRQEDLQPVELRGSAL